MEALEINRAEEHLRQWESISTSLTNLQTVKEEAEQQLQKLAAEVNLEDDKAVRAALPSLARSLLAPHRAASLKKKRGELEETMVGALEEIGRQLRSESRELTEEVRKRIAHRLLNQICGGDMTEAMRLASQTRSVIECERFGRRTCPFSDPPRRLKWALRGFDELAELRRRILDENRAGEQTEEQVSAL
jgi:hypothetical protein